MSACISKFKKMFKFATNLNHKVVSSSTMDIYGFALIHPQRLTNIIFFSLKVLFNTLFDFNCDDN